MKKIVIISEFFAPHNTIAAIRGTKLAKFFHLSENFHVTAVSRKLYDSEIEDPILKEDLKFVDDHITVTGAKTLQRLLVHKHRLFNIRYRNITKPKKGLNHIFNPLYSFVLMLRIYFIYAVIFYLETIDYPKRAVSQIRKNTTEFDIILSSYGPLSSHIIGKKMKRRFPKAFWIADFQDPFPTGMAIRDKFHSFARNYMNRLLKNVDVITGVTEVCVQILQDKFGSIIHIISNGFDEDELMDIPPLDKAGEKNFTLTYPGSLNTGKSCLRIVFKAIRELIDEREIDKEDILINYAGKSGEEFTRQIKEYNLLDVVKNHGFIDRKHSLQLQLNSDILLLATWNNVGDTGIVTGKFLEYLTINKPIICTVTGNLANSQLKGMIASANVGAVWEEANNDSDYPALKAYILEQYKLFSNNEPLLFSPNIEYRKQYDYNTLIKQFINILEELN